MQNNRIALTALLLCLALSALARAQVGRDPLNPVEADQITNAAGHLDQRIDLLLQFAHQRLTDFEQTRTMTPRPPDRANKLYELLREYEEILPEVDDNLDDLEDNRRTSEDSGKYNQAKILAHVIEAETEMRQMLQAIQTNSSASDLATYHFVLQDCFDATDDSLQGARQAQAHPAPKKGGRLQ